MKSQMGQALKALRSPVEGVLWIYSTGLFLYACYLASPLYNMAGSVVSSSLSPPGMYGLAVLFMIVSLPGIIAPLLKNRTKALKFATFGIFLAFLFLVILRVTLVGWVPVLWFPQLLVSLTSGYLHLWLKVRRE